MADYSEQLAQLRAAAAAKWADAEVKRVAYQDAVNVWQEASAAHLAALTTWAASFAGALVETELEAAGLPAAQVRAATPELGRTRLKVWGR